MTTEWRDIALKLRNALMNSKKLWEYNELLQHVDELLEKEEDRTPLKWLGLSVRIENALLRNGCDTIEKLQKLRDDQLLSIRGLGESSISEIRKVLQRWSIAPGISQESP